MVGRAQPTKVTTGEDGKWHTVVVSIARAKRLLASIDGQKEVLGYHRPFKTLYSRSTGLIGLQINKGKIEFRNMWHFDLLKMKPMFDEKTLAGWRAVPGSKSKFSVDDKTIHLHKRTWLFRNRTRLTQILFCSLIARRTESILTVVSSFGQNSGTEKAPSNGYELQIHHTFANEDRSQPNDYKTGFGTGAVFRRQKARWVNADDFKWCKITLVANGNHFASWVNGYQVNDFIDTRKINDNPRKGLRTKAGHLSLQGHDDTTDISFKSLNIATLP